MYTHRITWTEYNKKMGFVVTKSFPTTLDAVQIHLQRLTKFGIIAIVEEIKGV